MKIILLLISFLSFAEVCTYNFGNESLNLNSPVSKKWKDGSFEYNVQIKDFNSLDNYITISNGKYKVTYEVDCSK